jgi:hypothetical protein
MLTASRSYVLNLLRPLFLAGPLLAGAMLACQLVGMGFPNVAYVSVALVGALGAVTLFGIAFLSSKFVKGLNAMSEGMNRMTRELASTSSEGSAAPQHSIPMLPVRHFWIEAFVGSIVLIAMLFVLSLCVQSQFEQNRGWMVLLGSLVPITLSCLNDYVQSKRVIQLAKARQIERGQANAYP